MKLFLALSPAEYAKGVFDAWRARLEDAFARVHVKGEDIEVGQTRDGTGALVSARLILRDEATGLRYKVRVSGGVLSIVAIP